MSDTDADCGLVQSGSPSESTKSNGSTMAFKSSQNSLQSNDSHYVASNYIQSRVSDDSLVQNEDHSNSCELNMEIPMQSVECRASEIMELVKNGAFEKLQQKITSLLKENDELKIRLKGMKSNFNQFQENDTIKKVMNPDEDFCIDAVPSQFDHSVPGTSMRQEMGNEINYDLIKGDENVLSSTPKSTACATETKNGKTSFANSCFNCLGDHIISDCKEPKDFKRINKNRRSFQSQKGVTSSRYHVEEGQKFGHIQPGQPSSSSLMKALGMKDDRYLPPYIYQMRKLGYPSAWLKYAQINPSGLSLYMARGTKLEAFVSDVNNGEDGEISFVEESKKKMEYDVEKLIGWPGFNVEPDKEYKEECRMYRAPPLQLDRTTQNFQSLKAMKQRLSAHQQKGYVRGEMQNTNVIIMSPDSPEETKKNGEPEPPGINTMDITEEPIQHSTPQFKPASVKSTDPGTPIVDTYSPYNELPASEKWTCFTTDHIFFENLPESTGKYDKMVGILKKCRDAKKEIEKIAHNTTTSNGTTPSGS